MNRKDPYRRIIRVRNGAFRLDETGIEGKDARGLQIQLKWREIASIRWGFKGLVLSDSFHFEDLKMVWNDRF